MHTWLSRLGLVALVALGTAALTGGAVPAIAQDTPQTQPAQPAPLGPTYTLRERFEVGITKTEKVQMSSKQDIAFKQNGQAVITMKQEEREDRLSHVTTDALHENGSPKRQTIRYERYRTTTSQTQELPGNPPQKSTNSSTDEREGKTVVIAIDATGKRAIVKDGGVGLGSRIEILGETELDWYPTKPVAVGEKWPLTKDALTRGFADEGLDLKKGEVSLTLVKVTKNAAGEEIAHVAMAGTVTLSSEEDGNTTSLELTITGSARFNISRGRLVSNDNKGTGKITMNMNGMPLSGTLSLTRTTTYTYKKASATQPQTDPGGKPQTTPSDQPQTRPGGGLPVPPPDGPSQTRPAFPPGGRR